MRECVFRCHARVSVSGVEPLIRPSGLPLSHALPRRARPCRAPPCPAWPCVLVGGVEPPIRPSEPSIPCPAQPRLATPSHAKPRRGSESNAPATIPGPYPLPCPALPGPALPRRAEPRRAAPITGIEPAQRKPSMGHQSENQADRPRNTSTNLMPHHRKPGQRNAGLRPHRRIDQQPLLPHPPTTAHPCTRCTVRARTSPPVPTHPAR